eukprot:5364723-Prymnesium_polylepis.1
MHLPQVVTEKPIPLSEWEQRVEKLHPCRRGFAPQHGTSSDKTTGNIEVTNAHSAIAFATSSSFSIVQNVWPLRAGDRT